MIRRAILASTLAVSLAACSSTSFAPVSQPVNYARIDTIRLNAAKVDVVSDYTPRNTAPNVEQFMDPNPAGEIANWTKQSLIASGNTGYVQVHIKDASVISRQLGKIGGMQGYFTKQQSEELVAHISVEIVGEQRDKLFNGVTTVEASQLMTIPEDATPDVRKGFERDLINKLMTQFATNADRGVRQHLTPMVIN